MVGLKGRTARLRTAYRNAGETRSRLLQAYDEIVTIRQTLALTAEAILSSGIEVLEFKTRAS
jgi:hypothetical protein